ncbi:MAG: folate/biopterin family MFS transporter [Cyanobacteriota bacterium]|nr:folate/biopterin family MFS transporter [Cyanobacteriota bacterium]
MIKASSSLSRLKKTLKEKLLLGNEPTPELLAIITVYFVQGILGLARLAVSFFLKDELGLSPAQTAALVGISAIPWTIKPIFGFLSDGLPLFGYRRRPYLILAGLLGTWSWIAFATVVSNAWTATVAMVLTSLSVAVSDVIIDSLIVERVRHESLENAGSLQSLSWGTSALGGLITAYLSGWLLQQLSSQTVFLITATFPLLVAGVAGFIREEPLHRGKTGTQTARVKEQIRQLWNGLRQKSIWLPTIFVFVWQATPTSDSALFYFVTNELGFEPEFLGRVRLVTSIAALIGVGIYQRFLRGVPFRSILGWTTVLSSALGMTTLLLVTHANRAIGIDDRWFSLGDSLILTVMGQIAFMPVLVLSARLCPPGVEATFFALLMSIWNLAGLISHEGGALLTQLLGISETQFDRLWLLVVIANLSTLLPLPFLHWLPDREEGEVERAIARPKPESASLEAVETIVASKS